MSLSLPEGTAEAIRARQRARQVFDEVFAEARSRGMEVVISSLTSTEAVHARMNTSRLNGVLSGPRVVPVGHEEARSASKLLMEAGLHGHEYAIDAAVAEAALRHHRPVAMLTSDLCVRGVEGQCPVAPDRDLGHVEPTALRTGRLP